ncbi:MAG TPA: glycosyltransferase family 1 protein [Candidatus Hydrogenedentes bacterium]|nr:glycosyltransferase family 1 protein [Candidatus Hydrogenedentota bacterium]
MNILHINENADWRGGEQQATYLIHGLVRRGHSCIVAGRSGAPFLRRNAELSTVAAPFLGEVDLWTPIVLARAVRRFDVDIVHAHASHGHALACLARLLSECNVIVHRRIDRMPRSNALSRWKYRQADHYVAVCERVGNVLREFGVPAERITTIHSSIEPSWFDVEPLSREELGVAEGVPLLGCVGALVAQKNHLNLLEALPVILRETPQLQVVIIGEGELRGQIEGHIARFGLGAHVRLLGHRNDVPRILKALDLFVLPSRDEGIGGACIEALAAGVPVVATDVGGVGEVVQDGRTGLLVPAADPEALAHAVLHLLQTPKFAEALAARGRLLVHENFTVDRMVERTIGVYEKVLSRPGH